MAEIKDKVTFKGNPITLVGNEVKAGDTAPDFTVLSPELKEVKLSDYKGKVVVIAVFPSVDTGVCALQLARFNQEAASFGDDVQLLTISADLPFALGRYCADKGIANALTASDHRELDFGTKYGFVIKELRLLSRGTIIVDKDGVIRYVEYVSEVGEHPDYEKALEVIKELTK
ncbi:MULTISPECIES: thiol peroxidase [Leptotrichia]|uniref:thiol peroxidase n=1 Tax=Leptotrichia TaxID=32067 RepID=UPI0003AE58AF|nr:MULTISPECIES: thiol peroxidase [Leptotrichia]ERL25923.1 redoxin family protein [Leptotrichia sp. oral taxon 225 str. F0581]WLD74318.1 thiol peroxidase [Leptotrichia sp. HMT-225]